MTKLGSFPSSSLGTHTTKLRLGVTSGPEISKSTRREIRGENR